MNKIWMLSMSNIRKSKGAFVSLFIIIFVAAILLSLGLLTSFHFKESVDRKADELNSAHAAAVMLKQTYQDQYMDFFNDYQGVTESEKEDVIFLMASKFKYGTGEFSNTTIFFNADTKRNISCLSFVGKHKEIGDRDIYVSYILHTGGGYNLGDTIVFNFRGKDYPFQIAGYTEDMIFGSTNVGCVGFYLPGEVYLQFQKELNDDITNGVLLQARLKDSKNGDAMITEFQKEEFENGLTGMVPNAWFSSLTFAKKARTSTTDIGGAIIICFSLIIVLVSLLVIKFRVSTSIEDGMEDIGTLKALGYTSHQIIASILLQFILIAFCSALLGIGVSYLAVGPLSGMFSAQTGIIWKQGFDLQTSFLSLLLILLAVLFITPFSARRIKKLHPIIALRTGIMTHSFKKNHCPLSVTKGSLNFILAMKSMLINLKQNLMISLIIAAISFASIFGLVMYYNIVADNKAFIDMTGVEMCSVITSAVPGEDASILKREIGEQNGVRKTINYDYTGVRVNDVDSKAYITDDYSQMECQQVYEGRYPKYDNEVAINGSMAERFGKIVGDTIAIRMENQTVEYLITGLIQSSNYMGMDLSITLEGIQRMMPDYKYQNVYVYLEEGKEVGLFINEITAKFGEHIISTINLEELVKSQLGVYVSIVTIFAYIILIVTAFMVIMILYLVIKAMIIRRRREFGIQKALGYTTFQLMTQTSISFLPIVFLGSVIGSLIGGFTINSLISALFKGIGVMKVGFVVPSLWICILCVGISILSYLVSMVVSWRIRKITAYALITE